MGRPSGSIAGSARLTTRMLELLQLIARMSDEPAATVSKLDVVRMLGRVERHSDRRFRDPSTRPSRSPSLTNRWVYESPKERQGDGAPKGLTPERCDFVGDRSLDARLPRPEITNVAFMASSLTERVYWSSFKATFRAFPWIFASAA